LRAGTQDLPVRQRTLRDTIAWSVSLLSPDARVLLERLSVFVGSVEIEAIEQVTNPDGSIPTLDLLGVLVDTSLVRAVTTATQPYFGMLATIREFAAELLKADDAANATERRHEAYYLDLAEHGSLAEPGAPRSEWLDRIYNCRAVLRRAVQRGDPSVAVRI